MSSPRPLATRRLPSRPRAEPLDPLKGSPFEAYRDNYQSIRRLLTGVLAEHDLLLTEYHALKATALAPTAPTAISLGLGLTPASTTDVIDRLEARGLVRRERNLSDRRSTLVVATPGGARLYRQAALAYRRVLDRLATEMSPRGLAALDEGSRELKQVLAQRSEGLGSRRVEVRGRV